MPAISAPPSREVSPYAMLGAPCWGNCQSRRLRGNTVATLAPPDASYASGEGHDLHDLDAPGRTLPVHEVEGLVGLTARGGSSPLERMVRPAIAGACLQTARSRFGLLPTATPKHLPNVAGSAGTIALYR
jgi:hypothetical protein